MSAVQEAYGDFPDGTAEGAAWSSDQVSRFFDAFQQYGQDWVKVSWHRIILASRCHQDIRSCCLQVSDAVGNSPSQCEELYKQHSLYLNLASQLIQKEAFMGMVRGFQEHNSQASGSLAFVCPSPVFASAQTAA